MLRSISSRFMKLLVICFRSIGPPPHTKISKTAAGRAVERKRKDEPGIPSLSALRGPLSRYQKLMQQGSEKLQYHYSKRSNDIIIERTVNVRLRAGANYFDLPEELHTGLSRHKNASTKYKAVYQRLDAEMYFSTALTIVQPNNKGGRALHHSVYILVVMLFSFGTRHLNASEKKEMTRLFKCKLLLQVAPLYNRRIPQQLGQIGNAEPIPLAQALGKAFGGASTTMRDAEPSSDKERAFVYSVIIANA
ncbi:hypothetical protein BD769DRAFT_1686322 [Suillus cothurnatus]|nr:hypothetical protein BD769DRAFT_1686322 [Suillus cothurnatus]